MNREDGGKGAGVVGNTFDLVKEVANDGERNYGALLGHIASIGTDAGGIAGDPVSSTVSLLAGWAMEHIKPFKLLLDGLAGNPDMVEAASKTWKNVHDELKRLAEH